MEGNFKASCRPEENLRTIISFLFTLLACAVPCQAFFASTSSSFQVGFYTRSCPAAESIVTSTIATHFRNDVTIAAPLIRMIFHDCFVTGCDGSILINSTKNNQAEKDAGPNQTLRGYGVIDDAKANVESVCPGVVSCADILALASRDSLRQVGVPFFNIPTGRRDGRVSSAQQATNTLPSPTFKVSLAIGAFASQGFSIQDLVTLLGAHTVGATFCQFFSYRLYNFQNTNQPDPTMDATTLASLRKQCPPGDANTPVALDQGANSINRFDISWFQQIQQGQGVLQLDQELALDGRTSPFVNAYASQALNFDSNFVQTFVKLLSLNVQTGSSGGIRRNCAIVA